MTEYRLDRLIARVVVRALDENPKAGQKYPVVLHTIRPHWSGQGPGEKALTGGGVEVTDFSAKATQRLSPENTVLIEAEDEVVIEAAAFRVMVEFYEELGFILNPWLLHFVGMTTNESGYTTVAFAVDLPEKPDLLVKRASDGTGWETQHNVLEDKVAFFADHQEITLRALAMLDAVGILDGLETLSADSDQ